MKIIEKQTRNSESKLMLAGNVSTDGDVSSSQIRILEEASVKLYLNGSFLSDIPCTPEHLPELAAGWLFTERGIDFPTLDGTMEVQGDADDESLAVHVDIPSLSGIENKAEVADAVYKRTAFGKTDFSKMKNRRWLYALLELFDDERPLRKVTKASHSCMLVRLSFSDDGEHGSPDVLYQSEDAGRHSAMDKAIGWGVLNGIDMTECVLFTSGRISSNMAKKASVSGVLCLATAKPLLTTGAIKKAGENGMLLVGIDDITGEILLFR